MCRPRSLLFVAIPAVALIAAVATPAHAQLRTLKIVSDDSDLVAYAYVAINGGHAQITDERGLVNLGTGKKRTVSLEVRRTGFTPYYGKIDLPDTAVTFTIVLQRLAGSLGASPAAGSGSSSVLAGFYRRWLESQKGASGPEFIGPEEIEKRNASRLSALLSGVDGIRLGHTTTGNAVVQSSSGSCSMAIVVDGRQVCPSAGCHPDDRSSPSTMAVSAGMTDGDVVLVDQDIDINSVAAIEVYKRGGGTPTAFNVDGTCGVVAVWTGSRKP
jgi:hypothetical protein